MQTIEHLRAAVQVAHTAVARARRHGLLPSPSSLVCVDCGRPALFYDHREYAKPLDVEPVCRSCNVRRGPAIDSPVRRSTKVEG